MARLSTNLPQDGAAGHSRAELDLDRLLAEPPSPLEDLFNDPAIRERIGKLIGDAARGRAKSDLR